MSAVPLDRRALVRATFPALWIVIAVVFTGSVLWFAWSTSSYYGDDFSTCRLGATRSIGEMLFASLGSQIVPLHRAVALALCHLAPMRFEVALAVLLALHVVAVVFLYRSLELLGHSQLNVLLAALYATHPFLGLNFSWFSSGLTRLGYLAFGLATIYYFASYALEGGRYKVGLAVAGSVASVGFYTKGVVVPLYCAAFLATATCVSERRLPRARRLATGALLGGLCCLSVVWLVAQRAFQDPVAKRMTLEPLYQLRFQLDAWTIFLHTLFDVVLFGTLRFAEEGVYANRVDLAAAPNAMLALILPIVLLVVGYSIWRVRATAVAWLLGALLVSLNLLIVGLSNRGLVLGASLPFEYRHYYELCFLVVLFWGAALLRLRREAPPLVWLSRPPRRLYVAALCTVGLSAYAYGARDAYATTTESQESHRLTRKTRRYMRNLREDLSELGLDPGVVPRPPVVFVDEYMPQFMRGLDLDFLRVSQLFEVMNIRAKFAGRRRADYEVTADGHVVPVDRRTPNRGR